jgi:RHS repeat-associated protein
MSGAARKLRVSLYGFFAALLILPLSATGPSRAEVGYRLAAAQTKATPPAFKTPPGGDPATGAAAKQPACDAAKLPAAGATVANPGQGTKVAHDGATVDVVPGAVSKQTTITAESLCAGDLPLLDQSMTNVTKGPRRGYRFLPHMTFGATMKITLPYDPGLIPAGMTAQDVNTFYFDVTANKWQPLTRSSVDTKAGSVTSVTNHFTDFVDAVITVPDDPGAASDDPTSIKNIKAADPGSGVNLIAPPAASSDGSAHLSYPITVPAGRDGQTPGIGLSYDSTTVDGSSGPADGWMGLGWNLSLPAVTVDTQWGVPTYDATHETETYLLAGAELTPVANRGPPVARTAEKVFHSRVEGSFAKIARHGDNPKDYWWEVTAKDGGRQFFGGTPANGADPAAELTDASGNVFEWALEQSVDLHGNTVSYAYAHVSDTGIPGGTVTGTNMYPQSINYTGSPGAPGAYTVTFVRDRDQPGFTRRPDVMMSARGGFLMVTADLLKQIDITFNGQPVRSYRFGYTTGAFNKTLLESVTQLGASGDVFNTHTFTYYNDAQDANGDYNGFSSPAVVDTGNDDVTAGLLGQGRASALSGNLSTSVGGHLYVGFNPAAPTKEGSAGAKVGFTQSSSDGVLAMIDLNGDGLPDKVFDENGTVSFRLNTTVPGGPVTYSAQAVPLPTLPALSHETANMFSFGAEAYFGANVFANQAETFTSSDTYFQDVNGDGLPDLVENGQVLFNHLDANGVPTFTANSADTGVPVGGGAVDGSGLGVDFSAQQQQALANDPLVDTVREWVAPYDGTVAISGDVALIQDTGTARAQYTSADGVRVAIQQDGAELWSTSISAADYTPKTPAGVGSLTVHQGDRFYFRVQSVGDGKYDQVSWDPRIAYQNVTPATDVNGLDPFTYQASKDFTLAGRPGALVQAPLTGTVHLAGAFHKNGATSDDVTVQVLRNGGPLFSQTVPAAQTGDVAVDQDISVNQGDTLALKVQADSPIDVTQLSWTPQLYYTSSPSATVTDASGNPLVQLHPPVDISLYPVDDLGGTVQQAWTVPASGTVQISPQLTVAPGTAGTVTFTVKRPGALVAKQSVTIAGGSVPDASFSLAVNQGDQLYLDFSSSDPQLAAEVTAESVQVTYPGQSAVQVPSALHSAAAPTLASEPYRGWSVVGYNGTGPRALQPITESDLTQTIGQNTQYDPRTANAFLLTPSPGDAEWLGPNPDVYVKAASASSSRLGAANVVLPSAGDFAGARAPEKVSHSSQTAVGGGVSLLSGSADAGNTTSDVDYMDMNGSGFPAVVGDGRVQYPDQTGALSSGSVAVPGLGDPSSSNATSANVGVGGSPAHFTINAESRVDNAGHAPSQNTTGSQMVDLGLSGSLGRGDSHPQNQLIDMNGDGLPDIVARDGDQLTVSLNLGYSFAPAEPWGTAQLGDGASENGSIGASLGFNDGIYDFAGGVSLSKNKSESGEELIPMTGDGLPDRVINTPSGMEVAFNTGTGFAPPVPWPGAPNGACADNTSVGLAGIDWNSQRLCNGDTSLGAGAYFTVGIGPLCFGGCYIILNPGADGSQSMAREEAVLRDVSGTGAPDYVSSSSDGQMTVAENNIGRTNLLASVARPLGSTITVDYQRTGNTVTMPSQRWVMSKVTVDPGSPAGAVTQATSYEYSGGNYNRLERSFYGFATVKEHELDTTNNNAVYRTTETDYSNDTFYDRGLVTRTRIFDAAGHIYSDNEQSFQFRDVTTGSDQADTSSTTATIFPMPVRNDQFFYEGGATAQKSTYHTAHYDNLGNVDQTFNAGEPGAQDDVTTTSTFTDCPDSYLMSTPLSSLTTGGAGGTVMRQSEQTVDCASGDVTQVRQFLADGTAAVTDMTYFPDGNLATVTDPPNVNGQRFTTSYQYDPTVASYIAQTSDSFGLTSTTTTDLRFGVSVSSTDTNGQTTSTTLDEFGRTTGVTGPYQQGTGITTITFEYHPDAAVPWAITRHADVYRGSGATIDTVTFIDGLKRTLQTKKSATVFTGANSSAQNVMQVSGQVVFDAFGRTTASYYPTTEPLGTAGVYNPTPDTVAPTRYAFDVLDRETRITIPDGTATATAYGFGTDRSGATEFTTTATDADGHQKVTFRDVRSQMTAQEEFHNGTPVWTSYVYDPLSELTKVTDDHGNATTQTYDNLGRGTSIDNPDGGLVQISYDLAGNQTARVTPNLRTEGKQISYGYNYNRLISVNYPDNPQNNVTYTYGGPGAAGNAAGRVTQITDASGTRLRSYGKLGEVVQETYTVATQTAPPATYTTSYTYDTFGRLQSMVYPDGEVLTYHYDSGGEVNQVTGTRGGNNYTYVSRLEYDKFNDRAYIDYGNDVRTAYSYDPLNRHLTGMQSGPATGNLFQNTSYTYDPVGNMTAAANNIVVNPASHMGGPTAQQFGYDDLDRLVSASGTYTFAPGKTNQYTQALTYDSLSDITSKTQTNQIVQPPSTPVTQQGTTYTFAYAYNAPQPNAPTTVGELNYTYDANGNQTGFTDTDSGQTQTIAWNEQNQMQSLSNNGQETDYVYNDTGQRAIKRGQGGEFAYVNQYFTVRNGQIGTVQVLVGGTLVAQKLVAHDPTVFEKNQFFIHQDQVGSTNYVTEADGSLFEHLEYFPGGETWVQEKVDLNDVPFEFSGKQFDDESGFIYFGARYYNPRSGIFVSVDPALVHRLEQLPEDPAKTTGLDTFAPSFLNLYDYADNRPLDETDSDGRQSSQPLDTALLRQIAKAQGIGAGQTGIVLNRTIGRAFQDAALATFGLATVGAPYPENTDRFVSNARSNARGQAAGTSYVVPDAVGDVEYRTLEGRVLGNFADSAFIEVKAVNAPLPWYGFGWLGGLDMSYSKYQMTGLVDVTRNSLAAKSSVGPAWLIFLTTTDTGINKDVLSAATLGNVAVWQSRAFAVQNPKTGTWSIGLSTPELLNPLVFAKYEANPEYKVLMNPPFIGPTPLIPLPTNAPPRTGTDPDPTEVQP